jgi:hypothetical protein
MNSVNNRWTVIIMFVWATVPTALLTNHTMQISLLPKTTERKTGKSDTEAFIPTETSIYNN